MTEYPNREHKNADEAARRAALVALGDIQQEVDILRRTLTQDARRVDGDSAQNLVNRALYLTRKLSVLGALYEVREWHAADLTGYEKRALGHD
jgi:hypothetical protein